MPGHFHKIGKSDRKGPLAQHHHVLINSDNPDGQSAKNNYIYTTMFSIQSLYKPAGDQPQAIAQLVDGVNNHEKYQTLLGVTGSGKTFTIANVIQQTNRPTLVLTHNKTLVAQLYGEFKQFFPDNAVEYFVSYYD